MSFRPVIKLLPLGIGYLLIVLLCREMISWSDEYRYIEYAHNLTRGFYAPEGTKMLWNGPGYPLILACFLSLHIPLITAKLLNAFLLFGSVLLVYGTLRRHLSERASLWGAYLYGMYVPFFPELPVLLTEPLAIFLMAGFAFFLVRSFKNGSWRNYLAAGLFLGYLALTKAFFGYVIEIGLLLSLLLCKWYLPCRRTVRITLMSLLVCSPYLLYTYHLTGRPFYWANCGGSCLYWFTNPHSGEYGDWRSPREVMEKETLAGHRPFFSTLSHLNYVEQDDRFKEQAWNHIKQNPGKVIVNWVYNVGRMIFNYPYTYKLQNPGSLFFMFPNAILWTALLVTIGCFLKARKYLPSDMLTLAFFSLISLGGLSLLNGATRMVNPLMPVFVTLIGYALGRIMNIEWRKPSP